MKKNSLLEVILLCSPAMKKEGFEGKAISVSSQNQLGDFDILPQHTNFITLIYNYLTIVTPKKEIIKYNFKRGVLRVRKNKVEVFLGL